MTVFELKRALVSMPDNAQVFIATAGESGPVEYPATKVFQLEGDLIVADESWRANDKTPAAIQLGPR